MATITVDLRALSGRFVSDLHRAALLSMLAMDELAREAEAIRRTMAEIARRYRPAVAQSSKLRSAIRAGLRPADVGPVDVVGHGDTQRLAELG